MVHPTRAGSVPSFSSLLKVSDETVSVKSNQIKSKQSINPFGARWIKEAKISHKKVTLSARVANRIETNDESTTTQTTIQTTVRTTTRTTIGRPRTSSGSFPFPTERNPVRDAS